MISVDLGFQMSVALLTLVILSIVLEHPLLCRHLLNVCALSLVCSDVELCLSHILGCLCSFRVRHASPANSCASTVSLCYFYLAYITQNSQARWRLSGRVCGICAGFQNLLSLYSRFTVSREGSKLKCLHFPGFSTSALFNCGLNNSLFWGAVLRVGECTVVF